MAKQLDKLNNTLLEAESAPPLRAHEPPDAQHLIAVVDRPIGLKCAAEALGVPYHVVQRAARRGLVRTFRLGTSRPYVKLRDFIDLMERGASR
jgi:hypothetical protein